MLTRQQLLFLLGVTILLGSSPCVFAQQWTDPSLGNAISKGAKRQPYPATKNEEKKQATPDATAECDCRFFTLPDYQPPFVDLFVGESIEVDTKSVLFDPCISFQVLSERAAIKVTILDEVNGRTGPYPEMFLYSQESNRGSIGTDQYCGHRVRVDCLERDLPLPQPRVFVPFDIRNANPNCDNDHNLRGITDDLRGHKVLVLRKAYFWENSEDACEPASSIDFTCPHGPYGDVKIEVLNPRILSYTFDEVGRNLQIKAGHRLGVGCMDLCGQITCPPSELPGPIWSGYAPQWPFKDPFDEWVDGPWGCVYSNIVIWDWGTNPSPDDAIAVGGGEAGPSDDYLGARLVTVGQSEQEEMTLLLWSFGWITVRTITVFGPEPPIDAADVYWYKGWDGSYPVAVYGPPTIACPLYPAFEDCQRVHGSQFFPLTDDKFFEFLQSPPPAAQNLSRIKVGLLGMTVPPILTLENIVTFEIQFAPGVMHQGESFPNLNLHLYNYSAPAVTGPLAIRFFLSPDPVMPDPPATDNDIDLGTFNVNVALQPKAFQWVVVSGVKIPCDLPPGQYYLGTRVNGGPASSPSNPVLIGVRPDVTPPEISCPKDITVECSTGGGTLRDDSQLVPFFAGVAARDDCNATITNDAPVLFPLGATRVTFVATDSRGNSSQCTATVTVEDTTPPIILTRGEDIVMWPPDHKYHTINVSDCIRGVTDSCDDSIGLASVTVLSVSSDEAEDAEGQGDGSTLSDALVICPNTVQVRVERDGAGNGRVYRITYAATDHSGNLATTVCKAMVPHDSPDSVAIEGPGPGYEVNVSCGTPSRVQQATEAQLLRPEQVPATTRLEQNYPNPFNPTTNILFSVKEEGFVTLKVYNLRGMQVADLVAERLPAGQYSIEWNATDVPSGVYFYCLRTGGTDQTKKLIVVK